LARQLPADTPPRYAGIGSPPPSPPTLAARPGSALPALTPPPSTAPPVINTQTGFTIPALKSVAPATLTKTTTKTTLPPPPKTTTTTAGGGPKSVASKPGAPVKKPPAPPPIKTPTATAGVYRPASVSGSGHGPTQ
ncbi:MAG TPA: hypothetical protein VIU37_01880, partial [Candidatus Limnocylindrales bacterium]